MRHRYTGRQRRMSVATTDYVKVSVLVLFLVICLYTGVTKFVYTVPANQYVFQLNPNFSVCERCKACTDPAVRSTCMKTIANVYNEIPTKCRGYINSYTNCVNYNRSNGGRVSRCQVEQSNLQSCVSAVTKPAVDEWSGTTDPTFQQPAH